jgi:hypothetical protein
LVLEWESASALVSVSALVLASVSAQVSESESAVLHQ